MLTQDKWVYNHGWLPVRVAGSPTSNYLSCTTKSITGRPGSDFCRKLLSKGNRLEKFSVSGSAVKNCETILVWLHPCLKTASTIYQFACLLFDLSAAPTAFTKLLKPILCHFLLNSCLSSGNYQDEINVGRWDITNDYPMITHYIHFSTAHCFQNQNLDK